MYYLKFALLILVILMFLWGIFMMLPEKIRILRKYGPHKTNGDLIKMAAEGNEELRRFYKKSKIYLVLFLFAAVSLTFINGVF